MTSVTKLMRAALLSNEEFTQTLKEIIGTDLGISVADFSAESGISISALYKILNGEREPNLRTLREITTTIRRIEGSTSDGSFIAVIASRSFLNTVKKSAKTIDGKKITIREYPANTIEDAIIASIQAEQDGALALVCAPIVSPTIEKIVSIPIVTMMPRDGLRDELRAALEKIG